MQNERKSGPPQWWNDLFPSCPGIAKKLLKYLDLETVIACRQVYPEWEPVIDSFKAIQDRIKKISLYHAAERGCIYTAELLITRGADVDAEDSDEKPLIVAAESGHIEMVELLISKGANVNINDRVGDTPLTAAAKDGCFTVVERLLDNGADVNWRTSYGESPLILAASNAYLDIIQLLVSKGADIHVWESHGWTALILAAMQSDSDQTKEYCELAKYLISKGADVNHKDHQGRTALCFAAGAKQEGLIELLLENGASRCKIEHAPADVSACMFPGMEDPSGCSIM